MAAVYGIVRNHDGHVTVHSLPGEGTRVNIYLPALQSRGSCHKSTQSCS